MKNISHLTHIFFDRDTMSVSSGPSHLMIATEPNSDFNINHVQPDTDANNYAISIKPENAIAKGLSDGDFSFYVSKIVKENLPIFIFELRSNSNGQAVGQVRIPMIELHNREANATKEAADHVTQATLSELGVETVEEASVTDHFKMAAAISEDLGIRTASKIIRQRFFQETLSPLIEGNNDFYQSISQRLGDIMLENSFAEILVHELTKLGIEVTVTETTEAPETDTFPENNTRPTDKTVYIPGGRKPN